VTRALTLPFILTLVASQADAQAWHVGAKTGISQVETTSREFTWGGSSSSALFARLSFDESFGIQPEVAHVRRSGVSVVSTSTLRMVADYIEVPVLLHAQMRPRGIIAPFLNVGPNIALRVRCRLHFEGGGVVSDGSCEGSQGVRSARFDFGVGAGAGIGLNIDGATLTLESRVTTGLRHFVLPTDVADARSIGWSALVGVSFPLRRTVARIPASLGTPTRIEGQTELATLPSLPAAATPSIADRRRMPIGAPLITLRADDVDVRDVLYAIGAAAGVSVAVSPDVRRRVTAVLHGVPADQAIQAIADVAGLQVQRPMVAGGSTIVFHQQAVNVNTATPREIAERFGVSGAIAGLVVETRQARP